MRFSCFNRRLSDSSDSNVKPGRLVFDGAVETDIKVETHDRAAEAKRLKETEQKLVEAQKGQTKVDKLREKTEETIKEYNEFIQGKRRPFLLKFKITFGDATWETESGLAPDWVLSITKLRKEEDVTNLQADVSRLQGIIPMSGALAATDETNNAREYLTEIERERTAYVTEKSAYDERVAEAQGKVDALTHGHRDALVQRSRQVEEDSLERAEYENRDVYKRYEDHYEEIVGKDPQLSAFWTFPNQEYSSQREREMRQLLFAILSENTRNFTDDKNKGFILGPNFSATDSEYNRKNFPFIYEQWVKRFEHGVNQDDINRAQADVNAAQKQLTVGNIKDVEAIVDDEVKTNQINLDELPSALAGTPSIADQKGYHQKRRKVIQKYRDSYVIFKNRAEDEKEKSAVLPGTVPPGIPAERYAAKQLALEEHLKLEDKQIRLYSLKRNEEEAAKRFTRPELELHEQWCLEQVMRQLQKAVEIVDQPILQLGTHEPIYHAGARRALVAMVYREGVAAIDEDGVYKDKIADEYLWMLNTLEKSDYFNLRARGKFNLDESSRAILLLARRGNLWQLQKNQLEKEKKALKDKVRAASIAIAAEPKENEKAEKQYLWRKHEIERGLMFVLLKNEHGEWPRLQTALKGMFTPAEQVTLDSRFGLKLNPTDVAPATNPLLTTIEDAFVKASDDNRLVPTGSPRHERILAGRIWAEKNEGSDAGFALAILDGMLAVAQDEAAAKPTGDAYKLFLEFSFLEKREKLRVGNRDAAALERYIQNPTSPQAQAYIKAMRTRPTIEGGYNTAAMDEFAAWGGSVERTYNTFDLREKSAMDYLDRMGISIENFYHEYLEYIATHPDVKVEHWDELLTNPKIEEFNKLVALFELIPESQGGGKQNFLMTFPLLFKGAKLRTPTPKNRDQEAVARMVYVTLRKEIESREKASDATKTGKLEALAKMDGVNTADKILEYGRGVWDMVLSGDPVRMAAGIGVFFGIYKGGSLALQTITGKKQSMLGMVLAVAGGTLIADTTLKELTGEGVFDRLNLFDTIGQALAGTYEAVLVQQGEPYMKEFDVTAEQHTAALFELNKVPFHTAMEWYNSTTKEGYPNPPGNKEAESLWRAMGLSTDQIRCHRKLRWNLRDEEGEARFIVKRTIENFFRYVTMKDGHTRSEHGQKALEERWMKSVRDPNFKLTEATYTRLMLPKAARDRFRGNENLITWELVRNAEVDIADVDRTLGQHWTERVVDTAMGFAYDAYRWGRNSMDSFVQPAARQFWASLKDKAGAVKNWLGDMGEAGAVKLRFGVEQVSFIWDSYQYEIRHFADDHLGLFMDGIKLPFQILYGLDKMIVPYMGAKIRQFREAFRAEKMTQTKGGEQLRISDIVTIPTTGTFDLTKRMDKEINPQWEYFGIYQQAFENAFNSNSDYYESIDDEAAKEKAGVGYFISRVNKNDVQWTRETDTAEMIYKMRDASYEKAAQKFISRGATRAEVERLMYSIHVIIRPSSSTMQKTPEEMYVFWRMPLPNSQEYNLKMAPENRWTDYMDPNEYKHRWPFEFDQAKSVLENIYEAAGLNLPATRKTAGAAGIFLAQWLKVAIWPFERVGDIAGTLRTTRFKDWAIPIQEFLTMKQENKQELDERLTGAQSVDWAMSDFYKDKTNAWWYKAALNYAHARKMDLYLGHLDKRASATGANGFKVGGALKRESDRFEEETSDWGKNGGDTGFDAWLTTEFIPKNPRP